MENSKLILLLKTFDSSELRAFKDFINSPYFNKKANLVQLYNYLKKQASKGFPAAKLKRPLIFNLLYPGVPYDEKQLNYDFSLLLQLAERFVRLRHFENHSLLPDYYLLNEYVHRGLKKNYEYEFQRVSQHFLQYSNRQDDYYYQLHLVHDVADAYFLSQNERRADGALQQASDYFDVFFVIRKLKYLCKLLDRQRTITADYQFYLLEEVKNFSQQANFQAIPAIQVYYHLLLLLTEPHPENLFQPFQQLLFQHIGLFPAQEARELYQFAINFCIRQLRFGALDYYQILMELYLEGIESRALLEEGKISPWTFKNMVKLGISLKRFDWVAQFVKDFSLKLEEKNRADAYHFNLADLNYHQRKFYQALFHLNQVEFSDIHYHLGAKVMLLKIYYETQETEAFESLLSTFRVFLQRNKQVPKEVKTPYLNFINLLYQLYKAEPKLRSALREKINTTDMLVDRSWLLQKLDY